MHYYISAQINAFVVILVYFSNINCLHLISKKYYPSFESKNIPQNQRSIRDNILDRFHINTNTIIRTHDSRALGAKYLNETELPSNEDCLYWCWETSPCNLAVYEEKSRGSCYLFDCGSNEDFRCKFTPHNFYSSSILQINRHPYDLSQWGTQVKHEKELTKLRVDSSMVDSTSAPSPRSSTTPIRSLVAPSLIPTTTVSSLMFQKTSRCLHYQFECRNNSDCIAIYNVCDGIPQCSDASDEAVDLECHKSRFNVPNPAPNNAIPQSADLPKGFTNKQSENKMIAPKTQPSISIYHESIVNSNKAPQVNYNYPKNPDSDNIHASVDHNIVPKKHNFPPEDRGLKNSYSNQYRGTWNPYYQPNDVSNGGDNRLSNSGYLVEPEYVNSYGTNREASPNSGLYWPSFGRQQSYDSSDRSIPGSQSYQPLSNKAQFNIGDDWQQSNDRDSTYYEHVSRPGISKQDNVARPASLDSTSDNRHYVKVQPVPDSASKPRKGSNQQKLEQQLKSQSKEKNISNKAIDKQQTGYSHLTSNKGFIDSSNIVAVSYMHDSSQQNGRETNSAVIALSLGLCVTALLVVLVGCRMRSFKRKIARRGRTLAHDADYLVNGMYL